MGGDCQDVNWHLGCCSPSRDLVSSVQISLLDLDVLADDQPVGRHLLYGGKNPFDVLVGIHKSDYDRQLTSGIYQMTGRNPLSAQKSHHGVQANSRVNIFPPEISENLKVQGFA